MLIMVNISGYQSRVLGPTEIVDYSTITMQSYPPHAFQHEPFVGFKVLCRDKNAQSVAPAERMRQIDANLGFLRGKGCVIRETSMRMPDGFWVITLPVPRSQLNQQLNLLSEVLAIFEQYFGIVRQSLIEINVSGKSGYADTERRLGSIVLPQRYEKLLVPQLSTPYRLGHVVRINDLFVVFRSRWNTANFDDITVLTQILASAFN